MLFYPAWGKKPAGIPALSTGVKVSEGRSVQQVPGVRERCGEGGSPTRLCVSRGGIALLWMGAVLQLSWEVLRIHRLQRRYSFNHRQSACGLFHSILKKKKKGDFFSSFLEKFIFVAAFA